MLTHPTLDKIRAMKLTGMVKAFEEQCDHHHADELSFEERLGLLVDRETEERAGRALSRRLKKAKLRVNASVENIDFRTRRGLDRRLVLSLASCQWIREHQNILISGSTGVGKTFLACAFGHKACLEGHTTLYFRLPRLLQDLAIARGDGRYETLMRTFQRACLLILDDWGIVPFQDEHCRDLLEIMEDRYQRGSTLITSQLPFKDWHRALPAPTLADAILDRLFHNAHKLTLKGESMRRIKNQESHKDTEDRHEG